MRHDDVKECNKSKSNYLDVFLGNPKTKKVKHRGTREHGEENERKMRSGT
jgi:hypothetical protein